MHCNKITWHEAGTFLEFKKKFFFLSQGKIGTHENRGGRGGAMDKKKVFSVKNTKPLTDHSTYGEESIKPLPQHCVESFQFEFAMPPFISSDL